MCKSENGSTLVIVLITMLVAVVLGTTVLAVSLSETKFVERDESRMQAYYIARSAVEASAAWMMRPENNKEIPDILYSGTTGTGALNGKNFGVKIYREAAGSDKVIVESSCTVDGVTGKAKLRLKEFPIFTQDKLFDKAIFSATNVNLRGNNTIVGGVAAVGIVDVRGSAGNISGGVVEGAENPYGPVGDSGVTNAGVITLDSDGVNNISTGKYTRIRQTNGSMRAKLNGTEMTIEIDNIYIGGTFEIWGEGRLDIIVNGDGDPRTIDADFGGNVIMCTASGQPVERDEITGAPLNTPITLYIWMKAGSSIRLPGNAEFMGYIYGPDAEVDLNGCSKLYGAVVGKLITGVGTTNVIYMSQDEEEDSPENSYIQRFQKDVWMKP